MAFGTSKRRGRTDIKGHTYHNSRRNRVSSASEPLITAVLHYVVFRMLCCVYERKQLIALNIRRLRVAKGISQDDLALIARVERSCVGHPERGSKNPAMSAALSCDILELFAPLPERTTAIEPLRKGENFCI